MLAITVGRDVLAFFFSVLYFGGVAADAHVLPVPSIGHRLGSKVRIRKASHIPGAAHPVVLPCLAIRHPHNPCPFEQFGWNSKTGVLLQILRREGHEVFSSGSGGSRPD